MSSAVPKDVLLPGRGKPTPSTAKPTPSTAKPPVPSAAGTPATPAAPPATKALPSRVPLHLVFPAGATRDALLGGGGGPGLMGGGADGALGRPSPLRATYLSAPQASFLLSPPPRRGPGGGTGAGGGDDTEVALQLPLRDVLPVSDQGASCGKVRRGASGG